MAEGEVTAPEDCSRGAYKATMQVFEVATTFTNPYRDGRKNAVRVPLHWEKWEAGTRFFLVKEEGMVDTIVVPGYHGRIGKFTKSNKDQGDLFVIIIGSSKPAVATHSEWLTMRNINERAILLKLMEGGLVSRLGILKMMEDD